MPQGRVRDIKALEELQCRNKRKNCNKMEDQLRLDFITLQWNQRAQLENVFQELEQSNQRPVVKLIGEDKTVRPSFVSYVTAQD